MPNTGSQPSFIPREAPQMGEVGRARQGALADLITLISIVLVVASLALAAGVFLYEQFLQSSSTSKVEQLQRAEAAFEPALIQELTRLDDRMRAASEVLGKHISPAAFFNMLEASTIETVSFSSLNFQAIDPQRMTVEMDGVAASVNSIALQADLFAKGGMVTSPIFSNIDREADGVHFDLSALINPVAVNYVQLIGGGSTLQALPQQNETTGTSVEAGDPFAGEEAAAQ